MFYCIIAIAFIVHRTVIVQGCRTMYVNAFMQSNGFYNAPNHKFTCWLPMMASSNGNIFHVTGPLCGESTGNRWIDRSFDIFFDLRLNKRLSTPAIWDAIAPIMTSQ